jgi:polyisoprenoid-binding protein YceI
MKTLIVWIFLFVPVIVYGQKQAKLLKSESSVSIKGTSSLHDWEEKVLQFDCDVQVQTQGDKLIKIDVGKFKCNVKSIESGNSIMNSKTHDALKAETYPELKFVLKTVDKLSIENGKYSCVVIGDINIAGVTKSISFPITGAFVNNTFKVKGSTLINMPDFGVVPPTALMGTLKTGKEITIHFSLSFVLLEAS